MTERQKDILRIIEAMNFHLLSESKLLVEQRANGEIHVGTKNATIKIFINEDGQFCGACNPGLIDESVK